MFVHGTHSIWQPFLSPCGAAKLWPLQSDAVAARFKGIFASWKPETDKCASQLKVIDDSSMAAVVAAWLLNDTADVDTLKENLGAIADWDTSRVTNMADLFNCADSGGKYTPGGQQQTACTTFTADLSRWNVASVTRMDRLFHKAAAFNSDLSKWQTAKVLHFPNILHGATKFTGKIRSPALRTANINEAAEDWITDPPRQPTFSARYRCGTCRA